MKKVIQFKINSSVCNLRCNYCYLAQRDEHYQGEQPNYLYTPQEFRKAVSVERLGGLAYGNFCADGETLLTKKLDEYIYEFVSEGHYAEVVSNMTVTANLNKILEWDKSLLEHIEFKCSFHYLELKEKGLLDTFATNVNHAWKAGASINVELMADDAMIPYIDEIKEFSMRNFGALPHLSIVRNDRSKGIDRITKLPLKEYIDVWKDFKSGFWEFKNSIFSKRQLGFCNSGAWAYYIDIANGEIRPCYCGAIIGNFYERVDQKLPEKPVAICSLPHCYNGHFWLTFGAIPEVTNVRYGDIRDRQRVDGTHWLQNDLHKFFNSRLDEENNIYSLFEKNRWRMKRIADVIKYIIKG